MGGGGNEDGSASRSAIPLIAGAIVTAQTTMSYCIIILRCSSLLGHGVEGRWLSRWVEINKHRKLK
jgi:hypothetical protein